MGPGRPKRSKSVLLADVAHCVRSRVDHIERTWKHAAEQSAEIIKTEVSSFKELPSDIAHIKEKQADDVKAWSAEVEKLSSNIRNFKLQDLCDIFHDEEMSARPSGNILLSSLKGMQSLVKSLNDVLESFKRSCKVAREAGEKG